MIYLITNTANGKKYVGKTKNGINHRWYQHQKNAEYGLSTHFYRAIRKYGPNSFVVECIDQEYSNDAEKKWIAELQPEYNMTEGGDGGHIHDQTGNTWKVRDSSRMGQYFLQGNHKNEKWRAAVTGGSNYQCFYVIQTPWGEFDTWKDALDEAKKLRAGGKRDVVTDKQTLIEYCKVGKLLSNGGRRTFPDWRGKHTHTLGFGYEEKV